MNSGELERWSNWHVTVNTNKNQADLIYVMREAIELLPEPQYLWRWLKHYAHGRQEDFDEAEKAKVYSVRLRAAFENKGKQNKGLHVHILVEVAHSTSVQINKQGFLAVCRELLGVPVNAQFRFLRGSGEDKDFILHYMTKEVPRGAKAANPENSKLQEVFAGAEEVVEVDTNV